MAENLTQTPAISQKSSNRLVWIATLAGMLTCVLLVSLYFPKMISWYFEPPMPMGVSCTSSIRWAIEKMQIAQVFAILGGAIVGFLLGMKMKKRNP